MAQTKAATSKSKRSSRSSPKSNSKPKASSRSRSGSRASKPKRRSPSKPKASAGKSNSKQSSSRRPKSSGQSKPKAVIEAVEETAKDAGSAVGRVASRAKVPLVAGGAALAGVAGGLAFGARQAHRHGGIAGLRSDDVAKAARKVGDVGMQMGQLAYELRSAREASNGNGKAHRSPVEVVLEGLTARREHH